MKKSPVLMAWLAIPVAGTLGYFAGHSELPREGSYIAGEEKSPAASAVEAVSRSGLVSKWAERLGKCSAAELPAIYEEIGRLTNLGEKRKALGLLCARWAEVDAPGGVAFFSQKRESAFWGQERTMILAEWALRDLEGAYQSAKSLDPDQTPWVAWQLLEENPERFWEWFQKAPPPLPWAMGKNWEKVMAAHFEEVAAFAAKAELQERARPGSANAEWIYQSLAASLAAKDPAKAVEWARAAPESVRGAALQGALELIAKEQPEKIGEYLPLLEISTGGRKHTVGGVVKTAVETMAARDPLSALSWISDHYSQLRGVSAETSNAMGRALANAIRDGSLTPEQAFNAVRGTDKNAIWLKFTMYERMWDGMPANELAKAAVWLKDVDSKESRPAAMAALMSRWQLMDPAAARAFESQLPDEEWTAGYFRDKLQNAIVRSNSTNLNERVAEVLDHIPAEQRAGILAGEMRRFRDSLNPISIADSLAQAPASPDRDSVLGMAAEKWGVFDPLGVMEWAARQTDATVRQKVAGAAIESWLKEDSLGASAWLKAQPPGEMRDTGAHHLALSLRTQEPESAWAWAGHIENPDTRLEAQSAVLRQWRESSAAEARAALEAASASLAPEAKQRLWNTMEGRVNLP